MNVESHLGQPTSEGGHTEDTSGTDLSKPAGCATNITQGRMRRFAKIDVYPALNWSITTWLTNILTPPYGCTSHDSNTDRVQGRIQRIKLKLLFTPLTPSSIYEHWKR